MAGKLKECPFCSTSDHLRVNSVGSMLSDMPDRPYQVQCLHLDCEGVRGPIQYGRASAIEAWNRRADESDAPTNERYVIWSHEHSAWWRPNSKGYARNVEDAGVYSRDEALKISHRCRDGWFPGELPDELPVLVDDLPSFARDALAKAEGQP